jgi:hypothetical protein
LGGIPSPAPVTEFAPGPPSAQIHHIRRVSFFDEYGDGCPGERQGGFAGEAAELSREPKITGAQVLKAGADVRMFCNACQHTNVIEAKKLVAGHGDQTRLDAIEDKRRCTAYGSRTVECRPEYPRASGAGSF